MQKTMNKAFFVTGTDTEVGKTFVSCALLKAFERESCSSVAMKPIASGCELIAGELRNDDALALMEYATQKLPYQEVNPYAFEQAIAPHIAAQESLQPIELKKLVKLTQDFLKHKADIKLIEGAGGWLVPLNAQDTLEDYVKALDVPVILVVSIRLGCINHALLSARTIRAAGLQLAGWVANVSQDNFNQNDNQRVAENIDSIKKMIDAPLLAGIDFIPEATPDKQAGIDKASRCFSKQTIDALTSA